jgi:predicted small metal-binding protein
MKQFSYGDVMPGCTAVRTKQKEALLALVPEHAGADHDLTAVPSAPVKQVRNSTLDLSSVA